MIFFSLFLVWAFSAQHLLIQYNSLKMGENVLSPIYMPPGREESPSGDALYTEYQRLPRIPWHSVLWLGEYAD